MANNDYITTDCKLTVSKNTAKLDEEIFLYKNDRNIKLLIEIVDNKYRYKSDDLSNLLVKYKASYAQVKWYKNAEVKKEFPIQATDDGKVVFVIEGQLIDEDTELGDYDLQLRLLNESQESIRSLPIIKGAVHILKPLFEEGDIATVNSAVADVSMLSLDGDAIDTYNSDGTYNQTNWGNGDVISSAKLNKLEKVAKDNVDKVNKMPAKSIVEGGKIYLAKEDGTKLDSGTELPAGGTGTSYDDTEIKSDINTIKTDLGTEELTTTAKDVKGAVNEVAAQYKDIAKKVNDIKSSSLINQNGGGLLKIWAGTKVEYDALLVKQEDTVYLIEGSGGGSTTVTTYTITNNLTDCTNTNSSTSINENDSYSATITPKENYKLSTAAITMGETDITNTAYTNGTIFIEHVTGNVIITCTANQNSGETGDVVEPVYTLENELTLDGTGTGIVDTGKGLFDADRDFTIFADFTPDGSMTQSGNKQQVVFRVKQAKSPWTGVDISLFLEKSSENNPSQARGSLVVAGQHKQGIYLGKMATGISSIATDRCKFVIKRVASEKKMYFYDKDGLIGSYNDSGEVASNLFNDTVILGHGSGDSLYFKGTIHQFKIWYNAINDNDITSMLV